MLNGCEQPAQSQAPLGQMEAGLGADVSRPGSRGLGETPVKRRRCNHSAIVANSWTSEVAANGPPDQGATQITPFKHDPVPRWWKVTLGERRPWRGKVRRESPDSRMSGGEEMVGGLGLLTSDSADRVLL